MKNFFDLSEKVSLVTGGAGLLGKTIVEALAMHGSMVYVAEIDGEKARNLCLELESKGLNVRLIAIDITSEISVKKCVSQVVSQSGRLDVWVNNAYPRTKDWGARFEEIPFESWQENVNSHMNGYFLCCQKAAEEMKKKKTGSIINMASIYGIVGPDFSVYEGTQMTMPAAYSAIKGGIINFTRYLASYYGEYGVRVNSISPGGIVDKQPEIFIKNYSAKNPLKRMAKPEDIAGAVIYLASDASSYVTGHNLVIDGGWSII